MYITFLVLLPIVNALADAVSWQATRYFISRAKSEGTRALAILLELVLDVAVAALCLTFLALAAPALLEAAGRLSQSLGGPRVVWRDFVSVAVDDPLGKGIFVTGMLATTLIPTFLHLVAGSFGVVAALWHGRADAAAIVENWSSATPREKQQVINTLVHGRAFWFGPSLLIALAIIAALLWLVFGVLPFQLGHRLADLALWSGNLVAAK